LQKFELISVKCCQSNIFRQAATPPALQRAGAPRACRTAALASGPTLTFPRSLLPKAGSTPGRLEVSLCHVPLRPSSVGHAAMDRRSVTALSLRERADRDGSPYSGVMARARFTTKAWRRAHLSTTYLRDLRPSSRVAHRHRAAMAAHGQASSSAPPRSRLGPLHLYTCLPTMPGPQASTHWPPFRRSTGP
jgi:hypothetical protein